MAIETRTYIAAEVEGFCKTRDRNGLFSNMAGGMPLQIAGVLVQSTEAYYQAMRFPDHPDVQQLILDERSAMTAKRVAYEHIAKGRSDWLMGINIPVMRHALRLRYLFHRETMDMLFQQTGDRPIVEISTRDDFWGAKPTGEGRLTGRNVLGRLWMEMRLLAMDAEFLSDGVPAPTWENPKLLGAVIGHTPAPASRDVALLQPELF